MNEGFDLGVYLGSRNAPHRCANPDGCPMRKRANRGERHVEMTTTQLIEMQLLALRLLLNGMRITFGTPWMFLCDTHHDEVIAH